MDNIGGAEKVGLTLARELKADLYSTSINEDKIKVCLIYYCILFVPFYQGLFLNQNSSLLRKKK